MMKEEMPTLMTMEFFFEINQIILPICLSCPILLGGATIM
jgi:hypothetical protein